jgi:hypothetical protein
MPFVPSQIGLIDAINAIKASVLDAAGPVHTTVKLAKGVFGPTPTSNPASFTECDFDGYAAKTIAAYGGPHLVPSGNAEITSSAVLSWTPTGSVTPNVVAGYWLVGGNGDYLGGEAFPAPIPLNGPLTTLSLIPSWQQAPASFNATVVP